MLHLGYSMLQQMSWLDWRQPPHLPYTSGYDHLAGTARCRGKAAADYL